MKKWEGKRQIGKNEGNVRQARSRKGGKRTIYRGDRKGRNEDRVMCRKWKCMEGNAEGKL